MENIIKLGFVKFWIDDKNILNCQFNYANPAYRLDKKRTKSYIDAIITLCNGKAMPFLIDLRNARGTFSINAANLLANTPKLKAIRISEAFVFNSMSIELLISSYKRIYDPVTPYAMFNDLDSAKIYCLEKRNHYYGSL